MLLLEHSSNTGLASFAMKNMQQYQCLVMESGHKQNLKVFRAPGYLDQEGEQVSETEESPKEDSEPKETAQNSTGDPEDQTGSLVPESEQLEKSLCETSGISSNGAEPWLDLV